MPTKADRIIRAVTETPWAILPEKLEAIQELLELRASGVTLSADEVRARIGAAQPPQRGRKGGVAILPLFGVISHRMNLMTQISGGTSTEQFGAAFDRAMDDPDIRAVVIEVDSPGGSVAGVDELSRKIYDRRDEKPVIAVANTFMASAAYNIGSAAGEVVAAPSAEVGSIGVLMIHFAVPKQLEDRGIEATVIRRPELKAVGNRYEFLTEETRAVLQEGVDEFYTLFVEAVARNRETDPSTVEAEYGRGRLLSARQALDVGMVDRIATLEEVLEDLGVDRSDLQNARADSERLPAKAAVESASDVEASGSGSTAISMGWDANDADTGRGDQPEVDTTEQDHPGADGDAPGNRTESPEPVAPEAKEDTMSGQDQDQRVAPQEGATTGGGGIATVERDALAEERRRASEIVQLCSEHGMAERAEEYIEKGWNADRVGREILSQKGRDTEPAMPEPQPLVEMNERENQRYSIARAILASADNRWDRAGFEREVHDEITRKLGRESKGVYVPTNLGALPSRFRGVDQEQRRYRAALNTGTSTAGQELVFTEPGSFIDMLRTRMVTTALGATFLPGLEGDVAFPRQTGAGTLTWRGENPGSDVSDSDTTYDQLTLQPNDAQSSTAFSRRLLAQSVINVEFLVRRDLAAINARGIDLAALHGAGGNEPTGIYSASGVNSVAMGGAISWAKIVDLETQVAADDADIGVMAYATTPEVRGNAKTTEKASNTAQFLWTGSVREGEMNGFRAMASNQIKKDLGAGSDEHGIIFGVWSELYIGEWGALEIIVDPYTLKKQGLIEVTSHVMADVGLRHAEAFAKGTALTVS